MKDTMAKKDPSKRSRDQKPQATTINLPSLSPTRKNFPTNAQTATNPSIMREAWQTIRKGGARFYPTRIKIPNERVISQNKT